MATLKNVSRQILSVGVSGVEVVIPPGESIEADGKWSDHLFVKAEWLEVSGSKPAPSEPDTGVVVEDITGEDGVYIVRAADGVVFSPAKNQVRENGTLTGGGLRAYQEAKAAAEAGKQD